VYDVSVALRRFQGLIKWVARRYAVLGNFRLSAQDLEGEGYLVLVKCCRSFPEGEFRFARYFKAALYNHLKDLVQTERRLKRQGISVELVEAFGIPDPNPSLRESLDELMEGLAPFLTRSSQLFLRQLAEPSQQVLEYAWREFCRRNKIRSQGFSVKGYKRFRVKPRHIRKVYGWTVADCKSSLREIRRVYRKYKLNLHRRV
jgi:hypothetical protein